MHSADVRHAPAFRIAVLVAIGILAGSAVPATAFPTMLSVALLLTASSGLAVAHVLRGPLSAVALCFGVAVCVTAGGAKILVDRGNERSVPDSLLGGRCIVAGRVLDPPTVLQRRMRFTLAVESIRKAGVESWVDENAAVMLVRTSRDTVPAGVAYGMRIAIRGDLRRPPEERNPGEFSARRYYEANGITLSLFVRGDASVVILDSTGGSWIMRAVVVPARRFVLSEIDRTIGGEEGEFLKGLVIGERSGMTTVTRQAFVNAGVAHVLAVSGSNVAVVAMVLTFFVGLLRLPRLPGTLAVTVGILFYALITGGQPPVVRASVMALVLIAGNLVGRKTNAYNALGISMILILAADSRQLFDIGFQLSYGAVLSIIALYPVLHRPISRIDGKGYLRRSGVWLLRICAVSLAATLGTLPLTAISFGRVSVIGILANIVVIPATSVSVVLGVISSVAGAIHGWTGWICAGANEIILHWTLAVTTLAGFAPCAYIDTASFATLDALPYYALMGVLLSLGNPWRARKLFIAACLGITLAVFLPRPRVLDRPAGLLRLTVVDVGEGDAILVEFPGGRTMLVDAGPTSPGYDAGERIVAPYLRRKGIAAIDLLLLTHPHVDHLGGMPFLLGHFCVHRVVDTGLHEGSELYASFTKMVGASGAAHTAVGCGTALDIDPNTRVYVLGPEAEFLSPDTSSGPLTLNNTSVVVRILYGGVSFLLAGDAEWPVEQKLDARYGDFLRSSLLKVGHHGSSTSSSEEFIGMVAPSRVLISVGRNNKFRHPSAKVIQRFESTSIPVYRSDDDGAIVFETDGKELRQVLWR